MIGGSAQVRSRTWMGCAFILAFLGTLAVAGCSSSSSSEPPAELLSCSSAESAYPVRPGPTGRYLVDQNGVPFLMLGESPQAMIGNLSEADAELFLSNRQSHGFNTVWINLLCANGSGCNANGTTFDGIAPFTVGNICPPTIYPPPMRRTLPAQTACFSWRKNMASWSSWTRPKPAVG